MKVGDIVQQVPSTRKGVIVSIKRTWINDDIESVEVQPIETTGLDRRDTGKDWTKAMETWDYGEIHVIS